MRFGRISPLALLLTICLFLLLLSCSEKKSETSAPVSDGDMAAKNEETDVNRETRQQEESDVNTAKSTGIPEEHLKNYYLGWSADSAHFGWVTVEKDAEGLLTWKLWVINVITGVMPPFGNGSQMAQAAAFTGDQYTDINARNSAAYSFFCKKYIDPLEQQGFSAEANTGETLYEAESLQNTFKGGLKNEWSQIFSNMKQEQLLLKMNVSVSEKEIETENKAADGDAAAEKISCKIKQSLLKVTLSKEDGNVPQIISPGANYYYGVSAFNPVLLARSPNENNFVLILEKYNDTECGDSKIGFIGLEAVGGSIIGRQSAKK